MIPTANSSTKRNLTPPCSSAVRIAVRVTRCGILRPISKLSTVGFETFARSARSLWDQFNHARAARLCSGVTVYALCSKLRTFVLLVVSLEGRPGKTTTKPPSAMAVRPVFRSNRTVSVRARRAPMNHVRRLRRSLAYPRKVATTPTVRLMRRRYTGERKWLKFR
jgi:hypothetical protein